MSEMVVMAERAAVDLQSLAVDPLVLFPGGISVLLRAVGNLPRASFAMLLKFRGHALLVFVLPCLVLIVGHPAEEPALRIHAASPALPSIPSRQRRDASSVYRARGAPFPI